MWLILMILPPRVASSAAVRSSRLARAFAGWGLGWRGSLEAIQTRCVVRSGRTRSGWLRKGVGPSDALDTGAAAQRCQGLKFV